MTFFVIFWGFPNEINSHTQRIMLHSIISIIIQMNKQNDARLFYSLNTDSATLLNFLYIGIELQFLITTALFISVKLNVLKNLRYAVLKRNMGQNYKRGIRMLFLFFNEYCLVKTTQPLISFCMRD